MAGEDVGETGSVATSAWEASALPRDILTFLGEGDGDSAGNGDRDAWTLNEIADGLQVNDARVRWYLERLHETGRIAKSGDAWILTAAGSELLAHPVPDSSDRTIMPGRTVYDFQQAFADTAAGMFGDAYVQGRGEHGGRLSTKQAQEFQERLMSLVAEYFAPGKGDRSGTKYGFHWTLTPTDLHPLSDNQPT